MPKSSRFRVVRRGYDAKRAADNQVLIDDNWPSLKIFAEGSISVLDSGASGYTVLFEHGLGYTPLFIAYIIDSDGSRIAYYDRTVHLDFAELQMTDTELRWYNLGAGRGTVTLYVHVFLQDITSSVDAFDINLKNTGTQGLDKRHGFIVAKQGFSVNSAKPKDLIASSNYPSIIIHKLVVGSKGASSETIPHSLGYAPMYLVYGTGAAISADNGYKQMTGSAPDGSTSADDTNIYIDNNYAHDYSVLIFKDPIGI